MKEASEEEEKIPVKQVKGELPKEEAKEIFGKYSELKTQTQKEIEELEAAHKQAKGTKFTFGETEYSPETFEQYEKE